MNHARLSEEAKTVRRIIKLHLAQHDITAHEFAKRLGVSAAYVSAVMTGRKAMSDRMLDAIGYRRDVQVEYVKVK